MKKILIIDDDENIGNLLEEILTKENYNVFRGYSGSEALLILSKIKPDLILLDLMLPGLSGEEILPKIKNIPVIIISAKLNIDDKVNMLLGGAVDYITKPFNTKELIARISVHLRNNQNMNNCEIYFDDITLNIDNHFVLIKNKEIKLTKTEFIILKLLMLNPKNIVTKSNILDKICNDTPDCSESSLKVHISNLRKKLKNVTEKDYIESVWGIGFKLKEQ